MKCAETLFVSKIYMLYVAVIFNMYEKGTCFIFFWLIHQIHLIAMIIIIF
ncbi:hypothetical protein PUN28_007452 [Cardiocondyla obscurior]|uniref:Uncharacterized protein n=1 Tax=Cardiocondyla obscurior TaxID=286306 RepID=A0AAW2G9L2_9HYME